MAKRNEIIWKALSESLIGAPEFTTHEVSERSGVGKERAWEYWRALGFARVPEGNRQFTKRDIQALRAGLGIIAREDADPQVLMQIARVSGQSLARMVAVQVLPIVAEIEKAVRADDLSDDEAAGAVVNATEALLTTVEPFLTYAWRRHVLAAVSQTVAAATEDLSTERREVVGFADLVGFTAASQELTRSEIAQTVQRFENLAYEQIPEHGGRVVKIVGDEVMFTTAEPQAAARIALGLLQARQLDPTLPAFRMGMAFGATLAWEGDVYGPAVNLASRLTNIARPETVLVSEEFAEALEGNEEFDLKPIPRVNLKGIGKMRPNVLRPALPA